MSDQQSQAIPVLRADFAKRIGIAWQKSVQSFLEAGRVLLKAKTKLPHGDFTAMVNSDLPFGIRTAECLMSIAKHPRLAKANPHTCASLPSSWRALYELSRLPARQFDAALRKHRIYAEMTVTEASCLARERQIRHEIQQLAPAALSVQATVARVPISEYTVAYSGNTGDDALREFEGQQLIDALCSATEEGIERIERILRQDRVNDIEKVKQSIELLQRLGERLGGATIVPLRSVPPSSA
jgi:hypothetical protein